MKAFFLRHRKLHIWFLLNVAALAAYFLTRNNRSWMNALSAHVTVPVRRSIGKLCYRTDVSVMEVLCILLLAFAAVYVLWNLIAIIRSGRRRLSRGYSALLGAICVALSIYTGFCFLWGIDSYADGFQEKSGVYAQKVDVDDLYRVTAYFARELNETAGKVDRDTDGLFAVPRDQILAESPHAYDGLTQRWPFLQFDSKPPKQVHFSRIMSMLDFTGIYCPFTGETNVNVDSPACLLAATASHELAHQRGITSEEECNFLAVLACTTCGNDTYAYSGWLMGYIYLGNALYSADHDRWQTVYDSLPETARADMKNNNAYWAQFDKSITKKVSNEVYDRFLKGYGQTEGLKSYGMVVDLLVAYYK